MCKWFSPSIYHGLLIDLLLISIFCYISRRKWHVYSEPFRCLCWTFSLRVPNYLHVRVSSPMLLFRSFLIGPRALLFACEFSCGYIKPCLYVINEVFSCVYSMSCGSIFSYSLCNAIHLAFRKFPWLRNSVSLNSTRYLSHL